MGSLESQRQLRENNKKEERAQSEKVSSWRRKRFYWFTPRHMQISYTQICLQTLSCLERQTSFHAPVSDKAEQKIGSWKNLRLYCCPKATGRERFFKRFHLEINPVIKSLLDSQWDRKKTHLQRRECCIFFCIYQGTVQQWHGKWWTEWVIM